MHVRKIQIEPAWRFRDDEGNELDSKLFELLAAVHQGGKLTQAAKTVGLSYRHSWNLLNKWAEFFGCELVAMHKGRGASLTPLGEKLLWARERVSARFEPQLESLASELNLEIQQATADVRPVLRLHAAHGFAVATLPEHAGDLRLDIQYRSGEEALAALARGACDVAGFHVPTTDISATQRQTYSRLLKPRAYRVIRFIRRQQGLIVQPQKLAVVTDLQALAGGELRFINRQQGAATRALFDELLRRAELSPLQIQGYENEEFTHSAVAAYVASGMADVGFGVEHAANQFGMGFVPLASEDYFMVCHNSRLQTNACQRFLAVLRGEAYRSAVEKLGGYTADGCGELVTVEEAMPWLA